MKESKGLLYHKLFDRRKSFCFECLNRFYSGEDGIENKTCETHRDPYKEEQKEAVDELRKELKPIIIIPEKCPKEIFNEIMKLNQTITKWFGDSDE